MAVADRPKPAVKKGPEPDSESETVAVRIDELVVGRPLRHPIHDKDGVLLLAAGKLVTSEFKKLLRKHGIKDVKLHQDDAGTARVTATAIKPTSALTFDCDLAKKLDSVVDAGLLQVVNKGPAAKEERVEHGRTGYSQEKVNSLKERRNEASASITSAMRGALNGGPVNASAMNKLASDYLADMLEDTDCVMSIALQNNLNADVAEHCLQMSILGMAIGVEMGFDQDNCNRISVAGLVHDWGMSRVAPQLLSINRVLTHSEFYEIKKHPVYTAEILDRTHGLPSMVNVIAYQVHEKPNGLGYPRGRSGDRIHQFARILAVADAYTALIAPRPFRLPLAPYAAMEILVRMAKSRDVDPDCVRALLNVLCLFPIGSLIALSDGSVAQVIRRNGDNYANPIVQVIQDPTGESVPHDLDEAIIDLSKSDLKVIQAVPSPLREESLDVEEFVLLNRSK